METYTINFEPSNPASVNELTEVLRQISSTIALFPFEEPRPAMTVELVDALNSLAIEATYIARSVTGINSKFPIATNFYEAEFENLESTYTKLLNLKEKYGKKD